MKQPVSPSHATTHATTAAWVHAIIIEDEDLTFGGKSLSEWYEEDRRISTASTAPSSTCGSEESFDREERRGRDRTRRTCHYYSPRK